MTEAKRLPPKEDVARALLLRGSVFVHLDPRHEGVIVPPWLAKQPQLVLQVGLDLPVPIPDLRVDAKGVFGSLSFNRSPFTCSVPWNAIYGLVGDDGRGMIWPDDIPPEIRAEIEGGKPNQGPVTPLRTERRNTSDTITAEQPKFRSIEGGGLADESAERRIGAERPSYLKLVK